MIIFLILFIPALYILSGLLLLRYPPKSPNDLYGYRTKRASRSQHTWAYAQKRSAKLMITFGMIEIAVGALIYLVTRHGLQYDHAQALFAYLTLAYTILNMVIIVIIVQRDLRHRFDDQGLPIS